jgi:hypothetical protein
MRSFGRLFIAVGLGAILLVGLVSSVLAHDQADDVKIYVSSSSSGIVDGIEFKDLMTTTMRRSTQSSSP